MSNVLRLDDYRERITQEKPVKEVKKVSVDDGYTAIPNALIDAILDGDFTKNQIKLILGVIRKTTSWRKEMDWICNEQLAELCRLCDKFEASRVKKQLIKMNVLVQDGRKIGVNLFISDWLKKDCVNSQYCKKHTQKNVKTHNQDCRNSQPQKETITKEKINITPLPPKGESSSADGERNTKENSLAKNKKNRSAEKIDYQGVIKAFNEANTENGSRLPFVRELSDKRKTSIKKFLLSLKEPTAECACNYFNALFSMLRPFHFGEEKNSTWKANFDWAIRAETVIKVREENL